MRGFSQMKKKFLLWSNPKDALLTIVGILLIVGLVNVYSASFVTALGSGIKGSHFALKYAAIGFLAFIGVFVMAEGKSLKNHSLDTIAKLGSLGEVLGKFFSYKNVLKYSLLFSAIVIILLIIVLFSGEVINGARRWIRIGGVFNMQVSEIAKLCGIIISSKILGINLRSKERFLNVKPSMALLYALPLLYAIIAGALVLKEPDMGTMALIVGIVWVMYFNAGLPKRWFFGVMGLSTGFFALYCWLNPTSYHIRRIQAWIDPLNNTETSYQAIQAIQAIGSGGFTGRLTISEIPFLRMISDSYLNIVDKLGFGTGKLYFLPEPHTDFAFAVYSQEWGFIGALFLVILFVLLSYSLNAIAMKARTEESFLLVTGINFFITGQAFANMFMVTGLLPVIGVPMPFLSYGGSSLIVILASIWLAISVYNETEEFEEQELLHEKEVLENKSKIDKLPKVNGFRRWDR